MMNFNLETLSSVHAHQSQDLLNQLAHDLRTPIAALEIMAFELSQTKPAERIQVQRIINRMKEILAFNRTLKETTRPIHHLIEEVIDECRLSYYHSNIEIRFVSQLSEVDSKEAYFLESVSFQRSMANLISNAVDATVDSSQRDPILVRLISENLFWVIEVEDFGIGMSSRELSKIQSGISWSSKSHGSGIGMRQVSAFIKKQKGFIRIESKKGFGTKVILSLPKA